MRASYWSNSKFADKLREVFGLPKQPKAATIEGWDEFHKLEQSVSPFRVAIVESLDIIQKILYWPLDASSNVAYYLGNLFDGSHVLKTTTKRGQWSDLTSKIPDALMYAIIDYVEKECFWMNVAFFSKKPEDVSDEVWNYKNQSYLKRKLFPAKISKEARSFHGLQYIRFQMENCEGEALVNYQELIDAYMFAKDKYFVFDAFIETGYYNIEKEEGLMKITDKQRECFKLIDELEQKFAAEVTKHCFSIIKHREYLWT